VSPRGPWLISIDHPGVAAELATLPPSRLTGPGRATYEFATLTALHAALNRVYKLGVSLPDAPLLRFRAQTARLPQTTEAERLVVQRIGQDIFRAALMDYWGGRCPITGIIDPALLRALHIVPRALVCGHRYGARQLRRRWNRARQPGIERRRPNRARDRDRAAIAQPTRRSSCQLGSPPSPLWLFGRRCYAVTKAAASAHLILRPWARCRIRAVEHGV